MLRTILRVSACICPCLKGKDDEEEDAGSVESTVDSDTTNNNHANTTESFLVRGQLNGCKKRDEELMTSALIIIPEVIPSNIAAEDLRHLVGIFELFHGETVALSRDLGYLVGMPELFREVPVALDHDLRYLVGVSELFLEVPVAPAKDLRYLVGVSELFLEKTVASAEDLRYLVGVSELFREVTAPPAKDLRYLVGVAELFREETVAPAEDFRHLVGVSELFLEQMPPCPENLPHLEDLTQMSVGETVHVEVKVAQILEPQVDRTKEGRSKEGMVGPAAPPSKRGSPKPLKVISGNFAQNTIPRRVHKSRFPNTQCCSIAFTATLRARLIDPAHWTHDTVNGVVVEGDELHTRRIFDLGRSRASTTALTVEELAETVNWKGARYQLTKGPLFYGTLEMNEVFAREFGTKTFEDALRFSVERPFNAALVTMGEYTTAVIRAYSGLYLFDSHRRNRRVIPDANGTAILAKFRDVAHFVLHTHAEEKSDTLFNVVGIQLTEI